MGRRLTLKSIAALLAVELTSYGHGIRLNAGDWAGGQPDGKDPILTSRPIICVLTQPGDLASEGQSYLSAGYVKWLESAGARVAPVLYDMSETKIREMFSICNGVLFPGGNQPLKTTTKWFRTGELLYNLSVQANDAGETYPVLGTCLGLQLLLTIVSRDQYALVPVEAHNHPSPVQFTEQAAHSQFLSHVPPWVLGNLGNLPIAMFNHYYGLVDASLNRYPALGHMFSVLAHTHDRDNQTYVAMLQAKHYPFVGLAFHPEKVPYEWTDELNIPHTQEANDAAYYLASSFVSMAKSNAHRARNALQEDMHLIYNWQPVFSGKRDDGADEHPFQQVYLFELDSHPAFRQQNERMPLQASD